MPRGAIGLLAAARVSDQMLRNMCCRKKLHEICAGANTEAFGAVGSGKHICLKVAAGAVPWRLTAVFIFRWKRPLAKFPRLLGYGDVLDSSWEDQGRAKNAQLEAECASSLSLLFQLNMTQRTQSHLFAFHAN